MTKANTPDIESIVNELMRAIDQRTHTLPKEARIEVLDSLGNACGLRAEALDESPSDEDDEGDEDEVEPSDDDDDDRPQQSLGL